MIVLPNLKAIQLHKAGETVCVLAHISNVRLTERKKPTINDSKYIRVYLSDDTTATSFCIWNDNLEAAISKYPLDSIMRLTVVLGEYNETISIKECTERAVLEETTDLVKRFKPASVKHFTLESQVLFQDILDHELPPAYKRYVEVTYGLGARPVSVSEEEYDARNRLYFQSFASINHHDNYPGGYFMHICGMLQHARQFRETALSCRCESTYNIDWGYVFTGIMLHDCGKPFTYSQVSPTLIEYNQDCKLSHNEAGVVVLTSTHNEIEPEYKLSYAELNRLLYTILKHDTVEHIYDHNTIEDKLISHFDGMDAALCDSITL